jgi:hypothetical protein
MPISVTGPTAGVSYPQHELSCTAWGDRCAGSPCNCSNSTMSLSGSAHELCAACYKHPTTQLMDGHSAAQASPEQPNPHPKQTAPMRRKYWEPLMSGWHNWQGMGEHMFKQNSPKTAASCQRQLPREVAVQKHPKAHGSCRIMRLCCCAPDTQCCGLWASLKGCSCSGAHQSSSMHQCYSTSQA